MSEVTITKANFEKEVKQCENTVLLDFWATWCGPCKMIAPVVEQIAKEYEGKVKVGKVNVDEEGELAALFKIVSIPTLVVIKNGEVVNTSVGFQSKDEIVSLLGL